MTFLTRTQDVPVPRPSKLPAVRELDVVHVFRDVLAQNVPDQLVLGLSGERRGGGGGAAKEGVEI